MVIVHGAIQMAWLILTLDVNQGGVKMRAMLLMGSLLMAVAHAQVPTQFTFNNAAGVQIRSWFFKSAQTGLRPTVVMMHGCSGAFSYSSPNQSYSNIQTLYQEWGDRLVQAGYNALLIDSFSGRASGQNQCGNGAAGTNEVLDRPLDAVAAYDFLIQQQSAVTDPARVGLLGWSHGGSSVMAALSNTQARQVFKMAIAFYPGCGLLLPDGTNAFGGINNSTYLPYARLRIEHGSVDSLYTSGNCQQRRDRAWLLGGANTFDPIDVHLNAKHSFDGCKAVSDKCSAADVQAKTNADANAMNLLNAGL